MVAPIFVPELNMPVANARSFLYKRQAVVLIAAGKFPASPRPRMNRTRPNPTIAPDRAPRSVAQCACPSSGRWDNNCDTDLAAAARGLVIAGTVTRKCAMAAKLHTIIAAA